MGCSPPGPPYGFPPIFPDGSPGIQDYSLKKTLRMACDDMMAVEFVSSFLDLRTGDWFEDRPVS